jgi:hypothetical protein
MVDLHTKAQDGGRDRRGRKIGAGGRVHNQHSTGNPIGVVSVEFTPSPPCFPEVVRPFVFFPATNHQAPCTFFVFNLHREPKL